MAHDSEIYDNSHLKPSIQELFSILCRYARDFNILEMPLSVSFQETGFDFACGSSTPAIAKISSLPPEKSSDGQISKEQEREAAHL